MTPPIVGCVPNKSKCLSGVDTKLLLLLVGALGIATALVPTPAERSHLKVPPLRTVAIKSSPKLSSDHCLASIVVLEVVRAVPQVLALQVPVPQP